MISIKNTTVLKGLLIHQSHPELIRLLAWVAVRCPKDDIVITCGWEPRNYSSTHNTVPLRAIDIRSSTFVDPTAVEEDVNRHWVYDLERPEMKCAIFHDTGRGPHLHLQVHDNTKQTN
jgi:hypothetical protein